MSIGISTACFYPHKTEDSFLQVAKLGSKTTEVFFNSPSELEKPFIANLCKMRDEYGITIKSVHPFASFSEGYYYFSNYERRFDDSLEMLKKYFDVMNALGAEFLVIHGAKLPNNISDELYFERFNTMCELGNTFGVHVAHENVVNYRCESPEFIKKMADAIGDNLKLVLDIKQAKRAGFTPYDFIDELGKSIVHIHISDYDDDFDCITPLKGKFDFKKLFDRMKEFNYNGDYLIELYEKSFGLPEEIKQAKLALEELI